MSYRFDAYVNKNEAEAVKEMIFNRARQYAQTMSEEAQDNIMDLARNTFVSNNNPFSRIASANTTEETKALDKDNKNEDKKETENIEIGFPIRESTPQIKEQSRRVQEQITATTVQNNMIEARSALSQRKGFMGALNFLNTQAAVSLIKTRSDRFEIVV